MRGTFVVFKKEFLDTLRDKRTLVAMVLVPLVLFPLLMIGGSWLAQSQMEEAAEETLTVAVLGAAEQSPATSFQKRLASAPNIEVTSGMPADTARARIKDGEMDAAIVFAPSFQQQVEAKKAGTVNLIYESGDDSEVMLDRLRPHLDQYEQHFRT